jgi:hypothetical protein
VIFTGKAGNVQKIIPSAKESEDHKCGDSGQIILCRKNNSEVKIGILAGHDLQHYELRIYQGHSYDIFRVNRIPFLKAMADLGVGELDPGG